MSLGRRLWGPWLILLPMMLAVWWLASSTQFDRGPSVLSDRSSGWMLAHRYLEARGTEVDLGTSPLGQTADGAGEGAEAVQPAVQVVAFPWLQPASNDELDALDGHLRDGGTVVVAFSTQRSGVSQEVVLDRLGLTQVRQDRPRPLWPTEWWRVRRGGLRLDSAEDRAPLWVSSDTPWVPAAPPQAEVYHFAPAVDAGGEAVPMVFAYPRHRGRVVVLPNEVLANGRLGDRERGQGSADLLESLRQGLGGVWRFDEYHHGIVGRSANDARRTQRSWDLFAVHLVLLYGLALWALSRRFGPVHPPPTTRLGTTRTFLDALGALHHQLGHHHDAARQLVARVRRLDPQLPAEDLEARASEVSRGADLLKLAQEVAELQRRGRP